MIEAPTIYQIALPALVAAFGGAGLIFAKIMGRRVDAKINQARKATPEIKQQAKAPAKSYSFDIAGQVTATMNGPHVIRPSKAKAAPAVIAARKYRMTHAPKRYSKSQGRHSLVD